MNYLVNHNFNIKLVKFSLEIHIQSPSKAHANIIKLQSIKNVIQKVISLKLK